MFSLHACTTPLPAFLYVVSMLANSCLPRSILTRDCIFGLMSMTQYCLGLSVWSQAHLFCWPFTQPVVHALCSISVSGLFSRACIKVLYFVSICVTLKDCPICVGGMYTRPHVQGLRLSLPGTLIKDEASSPSSSCILASCQGLCPSPSAGCLPTWPHVKDSASSLSAGCIFSLIFKDYASSASRLSTRPRCKGSASFLLACCLLSIIFKDSGLFGDKLSTRPHVQGPCPSMVAGHVCDLELKRLLHLSW